MPSAGIRQEIFLSNIKTNGASSASSPAEVLRNEAARNGTTPAVSVVVSLYNYSAYITGCLDSVRASKTDGLPGGFEVVVVDDCSKDNSTALVEEYLNRYPLPLTLVKKQKNSGVSDTRNLGLLTARAPYVFILDADNLVRPDCLVAHYQAMQTSGCAMVYAHINRFDHATGRSVGMMSTLPWDERELVRCPMIDAMAMFRKDVLLQLGGYATEYGTLLPLGWEDYDLWLKLAQAGHAGQMIPQVLSDYRVHEGSQVHGVRPFETELAQYFSRKFHVLVRRHDDLPTLFSSPRERLAMASGQDNWVRKLPQGAFARRVNRMLGERVCQKICKRLASTYVWLYPRGQGGKN